MDIFNSSNADTQHNYPGEVLATVEHDGFTFTLSLEHDGDHSAPWEEYDGHGPVSEWERRDKLPGELVLVEDSMGYCGSTQSRRFYDFAEACHIARRDGWGVPMCKQWIERGSPIGGLSRLRSEWFVDGELHSHDSLWTDEISNKDYSAAHAAMRASYPSARAYAAVAARADFERLQAWCNNEWCYVGAIVTVERNGIELASASLWGIESDAGEYFIEVGNELASEALTEARDAIAALVE